MEDTFNLSRFLTAQEPYVESAHAELQEGRKSGHWIWFIFPQMRGLGVSWESEFYGISSLAEARAFLQHPVLGSRLIEFTRLVNSANTRSVTDILGILDAKKFRSSMTLFAEADGKQSVFGEALVKHFKGEADALTLKLIGGGTH